LASFVRKLSQPLENFSRVGKLAEPIRGLVGERGAYCITEALCCLSAESSIAVLSDMITGLEDSGHRQNKRATVVCILEEIGTHTLGVLIEPRHV